MGAFARLGEFLVNNKVHWNFWVSCSQSLNLRKNYLGQATPLGHQSRAGGPCSLPSTNSSPISLLPMTILPPNTSKGWLDLKTKERQAHHNQNERNSLIPKSFIFTNIIPFHWSIIYVQKRPLFGCIYRLWQMYRLCNLILRDYIENLGNFSHGRLQSTISLPAPSFPGSLIFRSL